MSVSLTGTHTMRDIRTHKTMKHSHCTTNRGPREATTSGNVPNSDESKANLIKDPLLRPCVVNALQRAMSHWQKLQNVFFHRPPCKTASLLWQLRHIFKRQLRQPISGRFYQLPLFSKVIRPQELGESNPQATTIGYHGTSC
jgi:hypothetical protein